MVVEEGEGEVVVAPRCKAVVPRRRAGAEEEEARKSPGVAVGRVLGTAAAAEVG